MNRLFFTGIAYLFLAGMAVCSASAFIELNTSQNQVGIPSQEMVCKYDDVAKRVRCIAKDLYSPNAPYSRMFLNVYVRKTAADNMGIDLIGTYPNHSPTNPSAYDAPDFNFYVFKDEYMGFLPIAH